MTLSGSKSPEKYKTEKEMLFCLLGQAPKYSERTIAVTSNAQNQKGPHLRFVSKDSESQREIQASLKLWSIPFNTFRQGRHGQGDPRHPDTPAILPREATSSPSPPATPGLGRPAG